MRVQRLHIENFRSIELIDIELQPFCAFIGPNNAGKSNILDALDLVLGETYPTIRAFSEKDFRNHDTNRPIEIRTTFDTPINDDYGRSNTYGITLKVSGVNDLEYFPTDEHGDRLYYQTERPIRISNAMREQIPLLHIDIDRRVSSQLRPTSWTLWGRIQKELNKKFGENGERVGNFRTKIGEATELLEIRELNEVENILRDNVRSQTNLPDLSLKFMLTDPIEHYKNLRPYLKNIDTGPEFDPEEMGLGTQSALVIALAEAYRQLVRESVVMLIDEPELYLHPHACRHFY
jgi:putative ATP-dependent endonuclease of OLD family